MDDRVLSEHTHTHTLRAPPSMVSRCSSVFLDDVCLSQSKPQPYPNFTNWPRNELLSGWGTWLRLKFYPLYLMLWFPVWPSPGYRRSAGSPGTFVSIHGSVKPEHFLLFSPLCLTAICCCNHCSIATVQTYPNSCMWWAPLMVKTHAGSKGCVCVCCRWRQMRGQSTSSHSLSFPLTQRLRLCCILRLILIEQLLNFLRSYEREMKQNRVRSPIFIGAERPLASHL